MGKIPGERNGNQLQYSYLGNSKDRGAWWAIVHGVTKSRAGGAPQKERGSGTSLGKAEGSGGEVSLLPANAAPRRARDNQTPQGFRLSSSALLLETLGLYRQAGGFWEGLSIVAPITLKVKSSCAFIVTGVYGDHALSTCTEIKRANQKF